MPVYFGATHGPQRRHPKPEVKPVKVEPAGPDFSLTHPKVSTGEPRNLREILNVDLNEWANPPPGYTFANSIKPGQMVVVRDYCKDEGSFGTSTLRYRKMKAIERESADDLTWPRNLGYGKQDRWYLVPYPGDTCMAHYAISAGSPGWYRGNDIYVEKRLGLKPQPIEGYVWEKLRKREM